MTKRILVIDDSKTIQKIFKIAFSRHTVEIALASSFIEAVSELNKAAADLLVIDAKLNGTRGPEDFKQLQAQSNGAPVLLLVGSHETIDEHSFKAAGFHHLLLKPFESQDILREVAKVLGYEVPLKDEVTKSNKPSESVDPLPPPLGGAPDVSIASNFAPPPPPIQGGGLSVGNSGGGLPPLPNQGVGGSIPLSAENMAPPPPPPSEMDIGLSNLGGGAKGKPAFQEESPSYSFADPADDMAETVILDKSGMLPEDTNGTGEVPYSAVAEAASAEALGDLKAKLEEFIRQEAPLVVRKAVEYYCERHFDALAKDVLTAELRRLAEEKARLLVD